MKNFIYILPLIFCFSTLTSCKKCLDCTCTQIVSQTGMSDVNQTVEFNNICDEELDDIEGTTTITQTVGGIVQTIELTCDCN